MSTSFGNNSGVQFANLGMTSVAVGITVTQTLYDSTSGQTTSTSYVPSPLNFILGSAMTQNIKGNSYQVFTNGTLGLTTNSSRMVEISILPGINSYYDYAGVDISSNFGVFRCIRGPSTVIGSSTGIFTQMLLTPTAPAGGISFFAFKFPASSIQFTDLSPISGAATYILEGLTNGLSTTIGFNDLKLFVRQI